MNIPTVFCNEHFCEFGSQTFDLKLYILCHRFIGFNISIARSVPKKY